MRTLKFSRISLLSRQNQAAYTLEFKKPSTVITGPNQSGKTTILKNLFEAFLPTKSYLFAHGVRSDLEILVEFTINRERYLLLKNSRSRTLYASNHAVLIGSSEGESKFESFLCELFGVETQLRKGKALVYPSASCLFLPFYVDQHKGWQKPLSSFTHVDRKTVADYVDFQLGVASNDHFRAMGRMMKLQQNIREMHERRLLWDQSAVEIKKALDSRGLEIASDAYSAETEAVVQKAGRLRTKQVHAQRRLVELESERALWDDQIALLTRAINELQDSYFFALQADTVVRCPTCGQQHKNGIVERFGLVKDADNIIHSRAAAIDRRRSLDEIISDQKTELQLLGKQADELIHLRPDASGDIVFADVVTAYARRESREVMTRAINDVDAQLRSDLAEFEACKASAENRLDRRRAKDVEKFFYHKVNELLETLKVDYSERASIGDYTFLQSVTGSRSPRAIAAYTYALLHAFVRFEAKFLCALVIDEPNQVGQDKAQLSSFISFFVSHKPTGMQLVLAAERSAVETSEEVDVIRLSGEASLLSREHYTPVAASIANLEGRLF